MKTFKELCGELKNVVVVTTWWDDVPDQEKEVMGKREEELMKTKGKFFEPLIAAGGQYLRHDNTYGSARRIMNQLVDNDPIALQIQVEMREGKKVEETAAGTELTAEMNKLVENHENEKKDMRKEIEKAIAEKNEESRKVLEAERTRKRKDMEKWETEKKRLAGDLNSVKQAAKVAQKEAERQRNLQCEEFLRKVREAEEKAERERKELKEAMDRISREKDDTNRRLMSLENTKNTVERNNRDLQARFQAQMDQTRRERETADRKFQQLYRSMRIGVR